jgi:hypothetical protein
MGVIRKRGTLNMKARLIILVVVAAGLAVFFALRASAPADEEPVFKDEISAAERARLAELQVMLQDLDLNCEETDEPADLSIRLEVDPADDKNRIYYYITEANGFFVETFNVTFFYKPTPETTAEDSPYSFEQFLNQYVPANGTLTGCIEVVPRELDLSDAGEDVGKSENWGAEITYYHSACTGNPDPMPAPRVRQCGT